MTEEQAQLVSSSPDSLRLSSLSEDKQALLVTLEFIEQRRQEQENELHLSAPYSDYPGLASHWQQISALTHQLAEQNQHTALLLNQQLAWTQKVLTVLHPLQAQKFYGPDGHPIHKTPSR